MFCVVFVNCLSHVQFCYSSRHWISSCTYPLDWAESSPEGCRRVYWGPTLTCHTCQVRLLNASACGSLPPSACKGQDGTAWKLMPLRRNSHPWPTSVGGPVPQLPQNNPVARSHHLRSPPAGRLHLLVMMTPDVFPPCFTSPLCYWPFLGSFSKQTTCIWILVLGSASGESPSLDSSAPTEFGVLCHDRKLTRCHSTMRPRARHWAPLCVLNRRVTWSGLNFSQVTWWQQGRK